MKVITKFMTKNDCYKAGRKIKPKGIMVHSTATPGIMAADWFSRWNKSYKAGEINRQVCVHAFLDDKESMAVSPLGSQRMARWRLKQRYPYRL